MNMKDLNDLILKYNLNSDLIKSLIEKDIAKDGDSYKMKK